MQYIETRQRFPLWDSVPDRERCTEEYLLSRADRDSFLEEYLDQDLKTLDGVLGREPGPGALRLQTGTAKAILRLRRGDRGAGCKVAVKAPGSTWLLLPCALDTFEDAPTCYRHGGPRRKQPRSKRVSYLQARVKELEERLEELGAPVPESSGPSYLQVAKARAALPSPEERRRIREGAGLSFRDMANAVGVTHTSILNWESGRRKPHSDVVLRYARILDELVDAKGAQ